MSQELQQQLTQDIDTALWCWLESHAQRDAIVIVNNSLNLADVGVAIATDNTRVVQHWIVEQLVSKPTVEQMEMWNNEAGKRFQALIVQPYILIQDL